MNKKYKIIDCDVHNTFTHQSQLYKYLSEPHLTRLKGGGFGYPLMTFSPATEPKAKRRDAYPPSGAAAGSDSDFLIEQCVDPYDLTYAVLTGGGIYGISLMPDKLFPSSLARASNDWLVDEWLSRDERFLGSIHVAIQDPKEAAREIRRVGKNKRMVQVLLPVLTPMHLSHEYYRPVIKAIADMDLVLALHVRQPGGTAPIDTPMGITESYFEWHTLAGMPYISQMVTLISSGVLEEFKNLKLLFIEGGFSWVPHYMWRLDQHYKAMRKDVPWLKKLPSEYITERCFFGTQPIEEPPKREYLHSIVEMMEGYNNIVFASDYPHWDCDSPEFAMKLFKQEWKENILYNNAAKMYGLDR